MARCLRRPEPAPSHSRGNRRRRGRGGGVLSDVTAVRATAARSGVACARRCENDSRVTTTPDAVIVGSGPNGLAAAIVLAAAGRKVVVFEAAGAIGGGLRSEALTLPGYVHDVCSAIHPFAVLSPFFRTLPLESHGLEWVEPPAMLAHPFDDGSAAIVDRSIDRTADALDADDGRAYRRVFGAAARRWDTLQPIALARFGLNALRSASGFARAVFRHAGTRALFAGLAAHGMLPLDRPITAGFGLVLGTTMHVGGWRFPRGGAQRLADALAAHL